MPFNRKPLCLPAILAAVLAVSSSSAKADGVAGVAAPNFKFSAAGASIDGDNEVIVSGTATTPVAGLFGAQLDGADAFGGEISRSGLGAHVFARDPSQGLVGVTGMWAQVDNQSIFGLNLGYQDIYRVGLEGEAYLNQFTLRLAGGFQDQKNHSAFVADTKFGSTTYGNAKLSYYATDNLDLSLEGSAFRNDSSGGAEVEWKPGFTAAYPVSLFASGGAATGSSGYGLLGVRVSFGDNNASLKDEHRRYDPPNIVNSFVTNESGSIGKNALGPI